MISIIYYFTLSPLNYFIASLLKLMLIFSGVEKDRRAVAEVGCMREIGKTCL